MKSYKNLFTIVFLMFVTIACREDFPDVPNPEDVSGSSYSKIFETYWNGMNNNYVFWDIDPTNWDHIHFQYRNLFQKLDINNPQDKYKAHTYFREMTALLVDSHYTLIFQDAALSPITPSEDRRQQDPDYHNPISPNHFTVTIPNYYLQESLIGSARTQEGTTTAISGSIDNTIVYFYCSSFFLKILYEQIQNNAVKNVLQDFFNRLEQMPQIDGIVIDVRGNGGGDLDDLNLLVGSMIETRLNFGYTRSKRGDGRLDYGPWIPAFVTPQNRSQAITAPIVVLADLHSVSMSEITTMAIQELPNGYFVGERTWGAQGPLTNNEVFNAGQFSSPFFNLIYTSSLMFKDRNGVVHEGKGLLPDIEVKYNEQALNENRDPQLERALQLIKTGQ